MERNRGFSLIELIIVIAIMAVLVAVITPTLMHYLKKSRTRIDQTSMDEIKKVMEDNLGLIGVSVDNPTVFDQWVDIKDGSAYFDRSQPDNGNLMAYSRAVADGIGKAAVPKTPGKTKFQGWIHENSDGSYEVKVRMI